MANIYVIDDEPVLLNLITDTLRRDGHSVAAFCDPLAILDRICTEEPIVDLLLTDVEMKPINGFEVVRRLSDAGFNAPVIYMSGYPSGEPKNRAMFGGPTRLDKPFTARELRSTVARVLAGPAKSHQVA